MALTINFHFANPIHLFSFRLSLFSPPHPSFQFLPLFTYRLSTYSPTVRLPQLKNPSPLSFDFSMLHDDQRNRPWPPSLDLCALFLAAFRSSHLLPRLSPAGLASFLLGASLTMMLGGSMTFLLGFLLLPWVIGLLMMLYLVGLVSNLSGLGRAILCRFSPLEPKPCARSTIFQASNFSDVKGSFTLR